MGRVMAFLGSALHSLAEHEEPEAESTADGVEQPGLRDEIRVGHQGHADRHRLPQHEPLAVDEAGKPDRPEQERSEERGGTGEHGSRISGLRRCSATEGYKDTWGSPKSSACS